MLIAAALLCPNAETWVLPAKVGVRAARALVDREAELQRTRERIAEYEAAIQYFSTPEGKEFARRLLYNESRSNERRAHLVPEDPRSTRGPIARVSRWFADTKARAGEAGRRAVAILMRLASEPPASPGTNAGSVNEAQAQEVLRKQLRKQAAPGTTPDGRKPPTS